MKKKKTTKHEIHVITDNENFDAHFHLLRLNRLYEKSTKFSPYEKFKLIQYKSLKNTIVVNMFLFLKKKLIYT